MTEKELEKLFKSKLDNREFAFNPANWEAMEAILDSEPKPAGAFYWRSVLAVLLFGVAVWSTIALSPVGEEPTMVDHTEQVPLQSEVSVQEQAESDNEPANKVQFKVETEQPEKVEGSQPSEQVVAASSNAVQAPMVVESDEQEFLPSNQVTSQAEVSKSQDLDITQEGNVEILSLEHKSYMLNNNVPQSLVNFSSGPHFSTESFKKYDTKSALYLEVAPIFSGSYNANNIGVGWKAGIGWQTAIGQRFQFNVGLGYMVQNGVGIQNNSDSVFYNFGKEVVETEIRDNRLDYVELPVSIGYKVNDRNMIQVGMYAGYLVNVSRDVNKEISRFKSETEYESAQVSGYQKEFRRMDYGLEFGYRYRLTPALSVGLHYNLGLIDITKNTQGDYLQRHTNQNTRVVFRYSIL